MGINIELNTIGSDYEEATEKVVHVHDGNDAVWVTSVADGNVLFCFEDSIASTVRSVRMSREQWNHLASLT